MGIPDRTEGVTFCETLCNFRGSILTDLEKHDDIVLRTLNHQIVVVFE